MKHVLSTLAVASALLCLAANAPANAQSTLESAYTQPADTLDGIQVGRRISRASDFDQDLAPATRVAAAHKCRAGAPCERHRRIH
jgi:hypothetical protein